MLLMTVMVVLMCGENRVELFSGEHVFIHPNNGGDGGRGGGSRARVGRVGSGFAYECCEQSATKSTRSNEVTLFFLKYSHGGSSTAVVRDRESVSIHVRLAKAF